MPHQISAREEANRDRSRIIRSDEVVRKLIKRKGLLKGQEKAKRAENLWKSMSPIERTEWAEVAGFYPKMAGNWEDVGIYDRDRLLSVVEFVG